MRTGATFAPHEASLLNLVVDKAHHAPSWSPRLDFATTVEPHRGLVPAGAGGEASTLACCLADLEAFQQAKCR